MTYVDGKAAPLIGREIGFSRKFENSAKKTSGFAKTAEQKLLQICYNAAVKRDGFLPRRRGKRFNF